MRRLVRVSLATGALLALTASPVIVNAETPTTDTPAPTTSETQQEELKKSREEAKKRTEEFKAQAKAKAEELKAKTEQARQEAKERQASNKEANAEDKAAKLEARKLQICEKRQTTINRLMTKISTRGQKQLDMITTVSTRVQAFKTDKNVTVEGYDALLAAVETGKTSAQAAIDASKDSQVAFKCDGSDPKGASSSFLEGMKTQNEAIKAYRDSVKELIKAVKTSQGSDDGTATPTPTPPAPTPTPPAPTPTPVTDDDGTADQGEGDN